MTTASCMKCGAPHEVDTSKIGWSMNCEACRQPWEIKHRSWMRAKHKAMVKKRKKILKQESKRGN